MASTFTPNINLEEPARGDDVGTWDVPVNSNSTLLDLTIGAIATISLNNSPVVLSAAQFRSKQITFNSTLTGSVAITFPSTFTKSYQIENVCTGSSAFVITLQTTVSGGQVICCPPGEVVDVVNDGTNLKFANLGRIGSFWDYGGSSVPAWVSGCTKPPYLNCDGSTFSAATYPALAVVLAGTTLPDQRGRYRASLNQGTGRLTSSQGGLSADVVGSGGAQSYTLQQTNLPNVTLSNTQNLFFQSAPSAYAAGGNVAVQDIRNTTASGYSPLVQTIQMPLGGSGAAYFIAPPTLISGLTMIRSA